MTTRDSCLILTDFATGAKLAVNVNAVDKVHPPGGGGEGTMVVVVNHGGSFGAGQMLFHFHVKETSEQVLKLLGWIDEEEEPPNKIVLDHRDVEKVE
jgi:hypothetical protein